MQSTSIGLSASVALALAVDANRVQAIQKKTVHLVLCDASGRPSLVLGIRSQCRRTAQRVGHGRRRVGQDIGRSPTLCNAAGARAHRILIAGAD